MDPKGPGSASCEGVELEGTLAQADPNSRSKRFSAVDKSAPIGLKRVGLVLAAMEFAHLAFPCIQKQFFCGAPWHSGRFLTRRVCFCV